jgi:hypothetical protein
MHSFALLVLIISLLGSLLYNFKASKNNRIIFFSVFLYLSFIVEIIGLYLSTKVISTIPLYNFFTAFEFIFDVFILHQFIHQPIAKKIFIGLMIAYFVAAMVNLFFVQGINAFHSVTYAAGCLLIVFCCAYYIIETLLKPTPVTLVRMPDFWICSALLFYYAVSFPIYGFANLVYSLPSSILRKFNLFIQILNIILYTMFSIAFLCRFKVTKSPLSLYLEPY